MKTLKKVKPKHQSISKLSSTQTFRANRNLALAYPRKIRDNVRAELLHSAKIAKRR